jgi:hypothetical protein
MRTRDGLPFGHPGCPVVGKKAGQFIDTGKTYRVGNAMVPLLLSHAAVLALGHHVGMLDRDVEVAQREELIELRQRVEQLESELAEADALEQGITALHRKGFTVKKARPRPPRKETSDGQ